MVYYIKILRNGGTDMLMRLLIATTSREEYADWTAKLSALPLSLELLGNAESATALLSMAEVYAPDVILVNSSLLPRQTLAQILKRWKKTSQVILVSPKEDYSLAVTALRCGIYDLIHGQLDPQQILQDLQAIKSQRALRAMDIPSFEQKRVVGKLLISYARRVHADRQLSEWEVNNLYGTKFQEGGYRFLTICLDAREAPLSIDPEGYINRAQILVLNATAELCHETFLSCDYFRYHVMLNYDREKDGQILALLQQSLNSIQEKLPKSVSITFCCSQLHESISDIIPLLDESGDAIWDRLQDQTGKLLIGTTPSACPAEMQQLFDNAEHALKSACSILDIDQFRKELYKLYQLPYTYKIRHEMRSVLRRTERYMFQINKELISTFTDAERTRWDLILQLRRVSTVDVYLQVYAEQMLALFQRILNHSVGQQSRPVRQAQQFIRQNYAASLSLETVARQVGLSPVYFSAVFKKETGTGFSDYLNQCRIDQAKKLLEETGLKVHAVSETVGFSGPRYFSRVFKNLVGVRPSEYRIAIQRSAAIK